jgi:hypothetical protein
VSVSRLKHAQKLWFDADHVARADEELGGKCTVLCLSPSAFRLLSVLSGLVLWRKRWYSDSKTDEEIEALAKRIYGELSVNQCNGLLDELRLVVRDELQAFGEDEMAVTVINNCGCGCGCGCGCSGGQVENPPDGVPVLPPPSGDDGQPVDPAYNEYKCHASKWFVTMLIEHVGGLRSLVASGETEYEAVNNLLQGVFTLWNVAYELLWVSYYSLVTWIVNGLTQESADTIQVVAASNNASLECALYGSTNPDDAKSSLADAIMSLPMSYSLRMGFVIIASTWDYEVLFLPDGLRPDVPEIYHTDCTCGGQGGAVLPSTCFSCGGAYRLVQLSGNEVDLDWVGGGHAGESCTITRNGDVFSIDGITSDATYGAIQHIVDMRLDVTLEALQGFAYADGIVAHVLSQNTPQFKLGGTVWFNIESGSYVADNDTTAKNALSQCWDYDAPTDPAMGVAPPTLYGFALGSPEANESVSMEVKFYAIVSCP